MRIMAKKKGMVGPVMAFRKLPLGCLDTFSALGTSSLGRSYLRVRKNMPMVPPRMSRPYSRAVNV